MKYKLKDIKVGDTIVVDDVTTGVVDQKYKDIKNGLPGLDYTTDKNKKHFCYLSQVTKVVPLVIVAKVSSVETFRRPKFEQLEIGDRVEVSVVGGTRTGIITDVIPEIKNGMDGISFTSEKEGDCWCYADQIIESVRNTKPETRKVKGLKKK